MRPSRQQKRKNKTNKQTKSHSERRQHSLANWLVFPEHVLRFSFPTNPHFHMLRAVSNSETRSFFWRMTPFPLSFSGTPLAQCQRPLGHHVLSVSFQSIPRPLQTPMSQREPTSCSQNSISLPCLPASLSGFFQSPSLSPRMHCSFSSTKEWGWFIVPSFLNPPRSTEWHTKHGFNKYGIGRNALKHKVFGKCGTDKGLYSFQSSLQWFYQKYFNNDNIWSLHITFQSAFAYMISLDSHPNRSLGKVLPLKGLNRHFLLAYWTWTTRRNRSESNQDDDNSREFKNSVSLKSPGRGDKFLLWSYCAWSYFPSRPLWNDPI